MIKYLRPLVVFPVMLAGLIYCLFFWGCNDPGGGTVVENPEKAVMLTFTDNDELFDYMKEQYASSVLPDDAYQHPTRNMAFMDMEMANSVPGGAQDSGSDQYSQTNIQEIGVDESDQVKTDGSYLYVAGQQAVNVVKAVPADEMEVVSTVNVGGEVDSLYLYNNILIILYTPTGKEGAAWEGTDLTGFAEIGMPYWIPVMAKIGLLFIDVSDQSTPEVIKEVVVDGELVSSRLTKGNFYVVQQFFPDLPPLQLCYSGNLDDLEETMASNREALEQVTIEDLFPFYELLNEQGQPTEKRQLVEAENFYRPSTPGGGSIASLMKFSLDDLSQPFQSVGIVADAHLVYASTQAIYLAATKWIHDSLLDEMTSQFFRTVIHKLDISNDEIRCAGSGGVKGKVLNQFSLGEYEDVLRIATTTGQIWSNTASNNIFCMQADDDGLGIIGQLEGLAPGEQIYAARFIGTRGYLVTFVQIDPLFTLDLSDPRSPKKIGELKVTGYSDYIHPLGENHLLTIGKDTKVQGDMVWYQGVQLSIFDITDFSRPERLYEELIGVRGTESEALYNHKAFTFWVENDLLAIPINLKEHIVPPEDPWLSGTSVFSGLYVYRVLPASGFEFLGRISTGPLSGSNGWTRGVFIDDSVYAVQADAVRAAEWQDIAGGLYPLFIN